MMLRPLTFSAMVCAGALLVLSGAAFRDLAAQSAVITGKVSGKGGESLSGATVSIAEVGAAIATTTAGTYTLTVPAEQTKGQSVTLRVRSVGYKPEVRQITLSPGTQTFDFQLQFDVMQLEEVVVTGTGAATERKNLTFAVVTADSSDLNQARSASALERVEVVEGVAAASWSGADGANGVVDVCCKRGQAPPDGKVSVRVRNEYGQWVRPKLIPITHAHPYLTADSAYAAGCGNQVLKGDFINSSGVLVGPKGIPTIKADQIADVPYSLYPHPVYYDLQGDLLTNGAFYTNY